MVERINQPQEAKNKLEESVILFSNTNQDFFDELQEKVHSESI